MISVCFQYLISEMEKDFRQFSNFNTFIAMSVIILVGFMGCGKTTFGKKIAKQLGYQFIDADTAIEKKAGYSVQQLFTDFGEPHFRSLERAFILGLKDMENVVVATGGGMPCFSDNMELLTAVGTTFYLKRSVAELANRLINAKKIRPLIVGKNHEELMDFITELLPQREIFYNQSAHILERDQQHLLFIQTLLNQYPSESKIK